MVLPHLILGDPVVDWLCADGGGIRGLSELIILGEIMERIKNDEGLPSVPRPCEYFDLIGGTSTGGYANIVDYSGASLLSLPLFCLGAD